MFRAEHFLSRLDRLPRGEVDLALELYRDPELLRAVLHTASIPDGAERAAISLGDPVLGPFLIVTRDGHFVTCLGRGMRVGELPVIPGGRSTRPRGSWTSSGRSWPSRRGSTSEARAG
jgi:hypothetical protein